MKVSRRTFLTSAAACAVSRGVWAQAGARTTAPSYFCTWTIQNSWAGDILAGRRGKETTLRPITPGPTGPRDTLDERTIFGPGGWASLYPEVRRDLLFMLDDGWDVGYGLDPWGGKGDMAAFGSHVLSAERFPSCRGTSAERLRALNRRLIDCGWRGLGVWVACQCANDRGGALLSEAAVREDLKRRLSESAEAGVNYWKVDWGRRDLDAGFRELISGLRAQYHPALKVEHKPLHYEPILPADFAQKADCEFNRRVLGTNDILRTYDVFGILKYVGTVLRTAVYSQLIDRLGSRSMLNVEDAVYIGAVLGHAVGVMSFGNDQAGLVRRTARWQELAPAFGGDPAFRTQVSALELADTHDFGPNFDYKPFPIPNNVATQRAPAVMARGLPLPDVRPVGESRPFVLAGRFPNGALAVGAIPRLEKGRLVTPPVEVALDAALEANGTPLGVFDAFKSVTVRVALKPGEKVRVTAADLSDGAEHDITAHASFLNGRMTLDGDVLARIGREGNRPGDSSAPAVRVTLHGGSPAPRIASK